MSILSGTRLAVLVCLAAVTTAGVIWSAVLVNTDPIVVCATLSIPKECSDEFSVRSVPPPTPTPTATARETDRSQSSEPPITSVVLISGTVGRTYRDTLTLRPRGPFTWRVVAGALPPGTTLNRTGVISGIPSKAGVFNFRASVTDQSVKTASVNVTVVVQRSTDHGKGWAGPHLPPCVLVHRCVF